MAATYYVPSGPRNLGTLFPTITWSNVRDYFIEVMQGGTTIATTPLMTMGCCCSDDDIIVHFLNYAGAFDSIPFQKPTITHETKSGFFKKRLDYPLVITDYGWARFNVTANDTLETQNTCLNETDMPWVQELFDSPMAYLQETGVEGLSNSYLPITIIDGTFQKDSANFGDKQTLITLKFKLSNEFIIQRN